MNSGKVVNHQRVKSKAICFFSKRRPLLFYPTMSYRESFTWVFCNSRRVRDTWNLWFTEPISDMNMEMGEKKKVSWILCHDDHLAAILTSDEQGPKVSSWLKLAWLKFLTRAMAMSDYKAVLIQFMACYVFVFLDHTITRAKPIKDISTTCRHESRKQCYYGNIFT